jgi:hypothetical protein
VNELEAVINNKDLHPLPLKYEYALGNPIEQKIYETFPRYAKNDLSRHLNKVYAKNTKFKYHPTPFYKETPLPYIA